MAGSIQAALAALQAGQISLNQLSMQLMALGANSQNLWQSQLAAVAARQLSQQDRGGNNERPNLPAPPSLPPPPPLASLQPQISSNEIQAIQQALQQQQQNIQQHLQNLLLLQQGSVAGNLAGAANNNVPSPFMGNQALQGLLGRHAAF